MTNEIKELRTELGLSQKQLGDLAGMAASDIGALERGERIPGVFNAYIIAQCLGKRIDEVFFL